MPDIKGALEQIHHPREFDEGTDLLPQRGITMAFEEPLPIGRQQLDQPQRNMDPSRPRSETPSPDEQPGSAISQYHRVDQRPSRDGNGIVADYKNGGNWAGPDLLRRSRPATSIGVDH